MTNRHRIDELAIQRAQDRIHDLIMQLARACLLMADDDVPSARDVAYFSYDELGKLIAELDHLTKD